jgi:hypothetical protein
MRHSAKSIFFVESNKLLREFESIFKTALAHESGDPGLVPFDEKTKGGKSRETVPLSSPYKSYFSKISNKFFGKHLKYLKIERCIWKYDFCYPFIMNIQV